MTSDKLRQCPFCGGNDLGVLDLADDCSSYVECYNCDVSQHAVHHGDSKAIAAWNTRAADEKVRKLLNEITDICKTADGWEDGETFYKDAMNSIRIALAQLEGVATKPVMREDDALKFVESLENPPEPNDALIRLLNPVMSEEAAAGVVKS